MKQLDEHFRKGTKFQTSLGHTVTIDKFLGEGGQGVVYRADYDGQPKAFKWYKPEGLGITPDKFYENITNNIKMGSPGAEFLWPQDITKWKDGESFGYVMDLRPENFKEVTDYLCPCSTGVHFNNYKTAADAILRLYSAFRILHNKGFSYQDINNGNFFIDPNTGKVLICDNDNVAPNGFSTGVLGKMRYMAPEIVLRKNMPNTQSDLFSLAVISFMLLTVAHPFEGRATFGVATDERITEIYGSKILFIFDPDDTSNRPDPVQQPNPIRNWPELPDYLKDMYIRTFGKKANTNPNLRPYELDWVKTFARFYNDILLCSCGNNILSSGGKSCICDSCHKTLSVPFRLQYSDYAVPALLRTRVYRCQMGVCNADEALNPLAVITDTAVEQPGALRFKNLGREPINAVTASGKGRRLMPKESAPLVDGLALTVNNATVKIEKNT